jgi:hypothetical protein
MATFRGRFASATLRMASTAVFRVNPCNQSTYSSLATQSSALPAVSHPDSSRVKPNGVAADKLGWLPNRQRTTRANYRMEPKDTLELWFRYEEIAMHFNNLLMQFRLQLMGGAGAIGTVASYLIGAKVTDAAERARLQVVVLAGLFVLIAAAASLDVFYYDRLLRGAVAALLEFEAKHPDIQMSTRIEEAVGRGKSVAHFAYGAILLLLLVVTTWSWARLRHGVASKNQSLEHTAPAGRTAA